MPNSKAIVIDAFANLLGSEHLGSFQGINIQHIDGLRSLAANINIVLLVAYG